MGHYDELPVSLETDKKARTISVIFRFSQRSLNMFLNELFGFSASFDMNTW